jgi:hypothetical protein
MKLVLMWLLERLQLDFQTHADFKKNNGKAITKVCRHLTSYAVK